MSEQLPRSNNQGIFRSAAMQHHLQRRQEAVFLPRTSRRTFSLLWIILGGLGLALIAVCWIQMPMYSSGSAIMMSTSGGSVTLIATLPTIDVGKLQEGQAIYLSNTSSQVRARGRIVTVKHDLSGSEIPAHYRYWSGNIPAGIAHSGSVLVADLDTSVVTAAASMCLDRLCTVEVETGWRTIGSFLMTFTGRRS